MNFKQAARDMQQQIVKWRRDLHQIPELSFELHRTSHYVFRELEKMGLSCRRMAQTGVVALIRGVNPGPTIGLRADMDGLPIKEASGLSFASGSGNMHACGHDAHMAMLLGAAQIISEHKDKLNGSVRLIFQPSEEAEGGAEPMIREGCLKDPKVEAVLGLHIGRIFPEVGTGQIGVGYGTVLAASSIFAVTVKGEQTHGSTPHTGVDPIPAAAEMILALQKIISRELNPTSPAVLTISQINGGNSFNIIPAEVTFKGDLRTVEPGDERFIKTRIEEICTAIAAANRAEAVVEFMGDFPATVNDESFTRAFVKSAARIVGKGQIVELKRPDMGNEDFSCFLRQVPGTYFFLGSHNSRKGIIHPHHHPKFDIDEDVLWLGSAVFAQAVFDFCHY